MFGFKYIAINELTNIEVKRFRTLRGAKRWYKKPMKLMGLKISKSSLFIGIHNINDLEVVTQESLVQESLNAFELMREYAKWDAEATTQISPEGVDRFESEIEEFDERCEDTSCLYCYGSEEEYERGAFDSEIPIAVGEEQDALPGLEQPMPAWEHELLYALTSKNCGDENCGICAAEAAAQEKREHKIDKNGKCSDCEYTSNDALQELVAEAQQAAEQEATAQETLFSEGTSPNN